jgi:hypothetical protein
MDTVVGAQIDESLAQVTLYVDNRHPEASDLHSGWDVEQPKETIASALEAAFNHMEVQDEGVRIYIAAGEYASPAFAYESGTPNQNDNLLIVEGSERGRVVIRNSEVVFKNEILSLGDGLFKLPWMENAGLSDRPWWLSASDIATEIGHRREMLYVNGEPLEPVNLEGYSHVINSNNRVEWTYTGGYLGPEAVSKPGTFGVSEVEDDAIYFRLPEGVALADSEIRRGLPGSFFSFRGKNNLVIRNLVLQESGNFHEDPAIRVWGTVEKRSRNVLIEDVEIHNIGSGEGLTVSIFENVTLRRLIIRGGGGNGITGTQNLNLVMEDLDVSENNWRSRLAGMRRWTVAGCKLLKTTGLKIDRYIAWRNGASGFWMDSAVNNVRIRDMVSTDNWVFGLYNEKNDGDTLIQRSVFVDNADYGLYTAASSAMTLEDSLVLRNGNSAIGIRPGSQDNAFSGSTLVGDLIKGSALFSFEGDDPAFANLFVRTYSGNHNIYWAPFVTRVFDAGGFTDLAGWREAIRDGQELDSIWEDPGFAEDLSGFCRTYVYEANGVRTLEDLHRFPYFQQGLWSSYIDRPVAELPRNWRREVILETHARLVPNKEGSYELTMSAGQPAALYLGMDDHLSSVSIDPVLEVTEPVAFRSWESGTVASVTIEAVESQPVYVVIRSVVSADAEDVHVSLAWKEPGKKEFSVISAPWLDSGDAVTGNPALPGTVFREADGKGWVSGWGPLEAAYYPWCLDPLRGILYFVQAGDTTFWIYQEDLGWVYLNAAWYPYLYRVETGNWVYERVPGIGVAPWWYDYASGEWLTSLPKNP